MRRTAAAALLLSLACVLAGCAATPPPPGLSVSLEQSRDNENRRLLQVVLANDGTAPLEVVWLQLRSPGFTDVAPTVRGDVVRPGRRLAFPIAYGTAACDRRGPARVVVGHRTADGLREAVLDVPATDRLLERLRARECALRSLGRAAEIAFAPEWSRQGRTAVGRLVVRRLAGDEPVTVTSVEGTVLLTLRPQAPLPLALAGGQVELPVVVSASRCDPHALTESKRTYDFPYYAALGDGEPVYATVRPDGAGLAVLERLLQETCAGQDS